MVTEYPSVPLLLLLQLQFALSTCLVSHSPFPSLVEMEGLERVEVEECSNVDIFPCVVDLIGKL